MNSPSLTELIRALRLSWDHDTAFVAEDWSADNPARGQCVASTLVVQDYYGGNLLRYLVHIGDTQEMHYCNLLYGDIIFDTTGLQYRQIVTFQISPVDIGNFASIRDKRLADTGTKQRYLLLKQRVDRILETPTHKP